MNITISNKPYTKDSKGFYIMPNELHYLLNEIGLTAQEKLIYECLIRYSNNSENNPFPSYSTIQRFASCGRGTISKGLKKLQDLGVIDVLHHGTRQGESNVYKIRYIYDSEAKQKASEKPQEKEKALSGTNTPVRQKKQFEGTKIPYNRGVHADIMTLAKVESKMKYYDSDEFKILQEIELKNADRIFDL